MNTAQIIVVAIRLIAPMIIPKKPLFGGLLCLVLDALDVVIVEQLGSNNGMGSHYHSIDKVLDLYYLGFEAWVASRWEDHRLRMTALVLFVWRLIGVGVFEISGWRPTMFVFPNMFENWFLFVLIRNRWFPQLALNSWKTIALWLFVLYIPKAGQEYLLHVARAQPWKWIKDHTPL